LEERNELQEQNFRQKENEERTRKELLAKISKSSDALLEERNGRADDCMQLKQEVLRHNQIEKDLQTSISKSNETVTELKLKVESLLESISQHTLTKSKTDTTVTELQLKVESLLKNISCLTLAKSQLQSSEERRAKIETSLCQSFTRFFPSLAATSLNELPTKFESLHQNQQRRNQNQRGSHMQNTVKPRTTPITPRTPQAGQRQLVQVEESQICHETSFTLRRGHYEYIKTSKDKDWVQVRSGENTCWCRRNTVPGMNLVKEIFL